MQATKSFTVGGCIRLFGNVQNTSSSEQSVHHPVHPLTMDIAAIPALVALLYTFCWTMVFDLW